MKTFWALAVKFLVTFIAALVAFSFIDGNAWTWVLYISIAATALNYLLGDLLVLPNFGNAVASAGDGIMGALVAYVAGVFIPAFRTTLTSLFIFAVLILIAEWFFHKFLLKSKKVAP